MVSSEPPDTCWKIGTYVTILLAASNFENLTLLVCTTILYYELFSINYSVNNQIIDQIAMIDFHFTAADYKKPCDLIFASFLYPEHWSVVTEQHDCYSTECTLWSYWRHLFWENKRRSITPSKVKVHIYDTIYVCWILPVSLWYSGSWKFEN